MEATISKFYTFKDMHRIIGDYVRKCKICEKTKTITNTKVPLGISSLGETLFDHCYIDYVGPIAVSRNGNRYIFSALCDLTQMAIAIPTRDATALTAAKCLLENVICRYNIPSRLISDNFQRCGSDRW